MDSLGDKRKKENSITPITGFLKFLEKMNFRNSFKYAIRQLKIESRRFTKQKIFLRRLALKPFFEYEKTPASF